MVTKSHAILDVSEACYQEIYTRLAAAGYSHLFIPTGNYVVIDGKRIEEKPFISMDGIALQDGQKFLIPTKNIIN